MQNVADKCVELPLKPKPDDLERPHMQACKSQSTPCSPLQSPSFLSLKKNRLKIDPLTRSVDSLANGVQPSNKPKNPPLETSDSDDVQYKINGDESQSLKLKNESLFEAAEDDNSAYQVVDDKVNLKVQTMPLPGTLYKNEMRHAKSYFKSYLCWNILDFKQLIIYI